MHVIDTKFWLGDEVMHVVDNDKKGIIISINIRDNGHNYCVATAMDKNQWCQEIELEKTSP